MKPFYISALLLLIVASSYAQWNTDSTQRNAICIQPDIQSLPLSCSDGHGGAIIAWEDERSGSEFDLYVQRIDTNGKVKWAANGTEISLAAGILGGIDEHYIVSDDAGGAVIFFEVSVVGGANHIYAQRIDSTGKELWQTGGVPISIINDSRMRDAEDAASNQACSDGAGGAFITWQEYGPFANYVQHVDKNGNVLWGANGLSVTTPGNGRYQSGVISTGGGTAVVAYSYYPILYLQRINTNGSFMWGSNGLEVADSAYSNDAENEYLVYDSVSAVKSVMVTWQDIRTTTTNGGLYSQKIDLNGNILWQQNGININSAPNAEDVNSPDMIIDKNGGFFIIYDSSLTGKLQHVNSSGNLLWGTGKNVSDISSAELPVITDDGEGGVIAAWHDNYFGQGIYAQHFDGNGNALWRPHGIPVIQNYEDINHSNNPIISAGNGSAIIAWADDRNETTTNSDIYAAKVGGTDGLLPITLLSFTAIAKNGEALLQWKTLQEINSCCFTAERSADGNHFVPISKVNAHGNSYVTNTYNATDEAPESGNDFYRLKMEDIDGHFTYSKIIKLDFLQQPVIKLYPEPATDKIYVELSATRQQQVNFKLCTLSGATLLYKPAILQQGNNILTIDVSNLAKGLYILQCPELNVQNKIIKE